MDRVAGRRVGRAAGDVWRAGAIVDVACGVSRMLTDPRWPRDPTHASRRPRGSALGMTALQPVVITHPLSSLTDEEIGQRIEQALPKIERAWLGTRDRE